VCLSAPLSAEFCGREMVEEEVKTVVPIPAALCYMAGAILLIHTTAQVVALQTKSRIYIMPMGWRGCASERLGHR
jgi:hypothetical protein